ncbi:MAG TPA: DUF2268 domain-containing putative Zn-dependent protease [Gemmatimonadales bacterium]|nr:DUF2268 domain-containing putative Zn-dependent protease [Gemmatimonadales bacterium]
MRATGIGLAAGAFALAAAASPLRAQHHSLDSVRVVTTDIDRFWQAYDRAAKAPTFRDTLRAFFEDYYLDASPGLVDFIRSRIGSEYDLIATIKRHPGYYRAMRPATARIQAAAPAVRRALKRWGELYPAAVFPDVYFVIGRMSSGGTTSADKILIGAEMYGRTPQSPDSELSPWHRAVLKGPDSLDFIVAHELIHVNQTGPDPNTLLGSAIQEGAADFLGELITGGTINTAQHQWGDAHEAELWKEFEGSMHGSDISHWLYDGDHTPPGRPSDLGYYVGYRITQAYYERATDKTKAIGEILAVKDYDAFLTASHYADRFAGSR